MGRHISKDELITRLLKLDEFKSKEYSYNPDTLNGSTKKVEFIHKNCINNSGKDFHFNMVFKDFISGQRCPCCAAANRIKSNTKNKSVISKKIKKKNRNTKPLQYYIDRINTVERI